MASQRPGTAPDLVHLLVPSGMRGIYRLLLQCALVAVGWAVGWLITVRAGLPLFSALVARLFKRAQTVHSTNGMMQYLLVICLPAVALSALAIIVARWRSAKLSGYVGLLIGLLAGAAYVYVQLAYWQYGGFGAGVQP